MCVVSAVRKYLALAFRLVIPRDKAREDNEILFYNTLPSARGKELATITPTSILRARLKQAKVPDAEICTYASNSLRKGGFPVHMRGGCRCKRCRLMALGRAAL